MADTFDVAMRVLTAEKLHEQMMDYIYLVSHSTDISGNCFFNKAYTIGFIQSFLLQEHILSHPNITNFDILKKSDEIHTRACSLYALHINK